MGTSYRWRLFCLLLGMVAGLIFGTRQTSRADRDIVFAAQEYRWSGRLYKWTGNDGDGGKPERTVEKMGCYHLYRINPDGTGRKQITFGSYNDQSPRFSPDGKQILFLRKEPSSSRLDDMDSAKLCLVPADGGPVRTLAHQIQVEYDRLPREKLGWSPDGRTIGYISKQGLVLLDSRGHRLRTIDNVEEFQWSPDGHRLYLGRRGSGRILDLTTDKLFPIEAHLLYPAWIDNSSLVGTCSSWGIYTDVQNDITIATASSSGVRIKKLAVNIGDTFLRRSEWSRLGSVPLSFIVVTRSHISDGEHQGCSLVNTQTRAITDLYAGDLIAIAPDGKHCAVAKHDWIGPYKRGGARLGALEIIDLATKKATAITSKLMDISDGDWRQSK